MRSCFIIFFILVCYISSAQTIGGGAAYNFLKLPATTLLSAAGGVNVSYQANEVGLAANNPALLVPELNAQVNASFNAFPGDIKAYSTTAAYHFENLSTTVAGHIYFVDYGTISQTDASGNVSGTFHPVDFVIQAEAAKKYLDRWSYGLSFKLINSIYKQYTSSALAFDVGILYTDSLKNFTAAILAKDMGFQLKTYADEKEDLPFDLQIGITQKLAKAPFAFSITAQHLHQFNTLYFDEAFNSANNIQANHAFFDKLINHIVVASHIFIGNNLEAIIGYNHLRRTELNIGSGNGLNGFSTGIRIKFSKLQVLYARANYQSNISYNQIGLNLQLNELFGSGKL